MGKKIGISSVVQNVQDYLVITFGLVLYATGFTCFQLPYEITTGGLAGAGAVLFYATGFPVHYTFFIVNILLLCVAIKVLGWKFCVKTIYAVFMLTFLLALAKTIMMEVAANAPDGTYVISPQGLPQLVGNNGMFMSCVIGASIEGVGIGLVFLSNGSTGGTDIIAAIINKYRDVSQQVASNASSTAIARSSSPTSCSTTLSTVAASPCSSSSSH